MGPFTGGLNIFISWIKYEQYNERIDETPEQS